MKNPFKLCLCCWYDSEKTQSTPTNHNVHINTCTFDDTILSHTADTNSTSITDDSSYRSNLSTTLMNK